MRKKTTPNFCTLRWKAKNYRKSERRKNTNTFSIKVAAQLESGFRVWIELKHLMFKVRARVEASSVECLNVSVQ